MVERSFGNVSNECRNIISYLRQEQDTYGCSLYEHLCDIVHCAASDRPENFLEYFEEYSLMLKKRRPNCRMKSESSSYFASDTIPKTVRVLFQQCEDEMPISKRDGDGALKHPSTSNMEDVMGSLSLFRRVGVCLTEEEVFAVAVAVHKLAIVKPVKRLRFWGKILGMKQDYIIVEAQLTDDELDRRVDLLNGEEAIALEDHLNKKVFFVCAEPGDDWQELPPIMPHHITSARRQSQFFSGDLEAEVPGFPGKESHLLHSQLARITASCSVSPLEPDPCEGESGPELADLLDPRLAHWVHRCPRLQISEEGRGGEEGEDGGVEEEGEEEDEEELDEEELEEEEEEEEEVEAEDLMTPLSEDAPLDGQPAWTPRLCSGLLPASRAVLLRSNRWPGAAAACSGTGRHRYRHLKERGLTPYTLHPYYTVCVRNRKYGNLYIGWGLKAIGGKGTGTCCIINWIEQECGGPPYKHKVRDGSDPP